MKQNWVFFCYVSGVEWWMRSCVQKYFCIPWSAVSSMGFRGTEGMRLEDSLLRRFFVPVPGAFWDC